MNGMSRNCYDGAANTEGVGDCHGGTQTCMQGEWGLCVGQKAPSVEDCDGLDNNCNGIIDDSTLDSNQVCDTGKSGICASGKTVCAAGIVSCISNVLAGPEQCNGLDDDCDGVVDDGNPGAGLACSTGKSGVCSTGVASCVSGAILCTQTAQPSPDVCDGKDNDCNGITDDGCPPTNQASYLTEPGYFDATFDPERHQVFLSYGGNGYVRAVSLGSGTDAVITTGNMAEHLFFEPILDQVFVTARPVQRNGYLVPINAVSLANPMPISLPFVPGDLTAMGNGNAYVTENGKVQIYTVNLQTGTSTPNWYSWNGTHRFAFHPSLTRFYSAYGFSRWNIVAGAPTFAYYPASNDKYLGSDLRMHPGGNTIYGSAGNVFLASNVQATDMSYLGTLGVYWSDLVFHPSGNYIYLLTDGNAIRTYDPNTLTLSATHPLAKTAQRIFAGPTYLVVLTNTLGGNPKTQIDVIPYANL